MKNQEPKLIVLEGPDGSGKTTLSDRLRADFGLGYRHEGPPDPKLPPFNYYVAKLWDAQAEALVTPGVVLDRFALGDRVYGPIFRGEDRFGDSGWELMRRLMDAVGVVRVLCLPPLDTCLEHWDRRHAEGREWVQDRELFVRTYYAWAGFKDDPGQVLYDWTRGEEAEYRNVRRYL